MNLENCLKEVDPDQQRHSVLTKESRTLPLFLSSSHIENERIHPATPKEDAHIESFNSILEKEVVRRFEFSSVKDADDTISRFIEFYNNERLPSAIGYKAPRKVYEEWKESIIEMR